MSGYPCVYILRVLIVNQREKKRSTCIFPRSNQLFIATPYAVPILKMRLSRRQIHTRSLLIAPKVKPHGSWWARTSMGCRGTFSCEVLCALLAFWIRVVGTQKHKISLRAIMEGPVTNKDGKWFGRFKSTVDVQQCVCTTYLGVCACVLCVCYGRILYSVGC